MCTQISLHTYMLEIDAGSYPVPRGMGAWLRWASTFSAVCGVLGIGGVQKLLVLVLFFLQGFGIW